MTESKRFSREIKRISQNFAVRPNEVIKRNTNDGNLSLTFKSTDFDDKELLISDKSLLVNSTINKKHKSLIVDGAFQLDLNKIDLSIIKLEGDSTLTYVENFDDGKIYQIIIQQNEIGNNNFTIHENLLEHVVLLGDGISLNSEPNSLTIFNLTVVNNKFFIEQENNEYKKVTNNPYGTFSFTIDTTLGNNAGPTFQLPIKPDYLDITNNINYQFNYDFIVDWGDGNSDHITSFDDVAKNHTYSTDDTYEITITGLCEGFGNLALNYSDFENGLITYPELMSKITTFDFEKIISINSLYNIGLIDAGFMFGIPYFVGTLNINNINTSDWDMSKVVNMDHMFYGCSSLTSLDLNTWNVSNVVNMNGIFRGCTSLTTLDVSKWNVSNVTFMYAMFNECSTLTTLDVSTWDVSNVTNMRYMFYGCSSLTTLDVNTWDVSNVTNMNSMFNNTSLTLLDVSTWDTSAVTDMSVMFYGCPSLTTLDLSTWDVSNVTTMNSMFSQCPSLTTLDVSNWDVSNVITMSGMFYGCSSLTTLDVSKWDVSNVITMSNMFYNTPLDTLSYDALLIEWSGLPSLQPNVNFNANSAKYSAGAATTAREILTSAPNNWKIYDAGQVV